MKYTVPPDAMAKFKLLTLSFDILLQEDFFVSDYIFFYKIYFFILVCTILVAHIYEFFVLTKFSIPRCFLIQGACCKPYRQTDRQTEKDHSVVQYMIY